MYRPKRLYLRHAVGIASGMPAPAKLVQTAMRPNESLNEQSTAALKRKFRALTASHYALLDLTTKHLASIAIDKAVKRRLCGSTTNLVRFLSTNVGIHCGTLTLLFMDENQLAQGGFDNMIQIVKFYLAI